LIGCCFIAFFFGILLLLVALIVNIFHTLK